MAADPGALVLVLTPLPDSALPEPVGVEHRLRRVLKYALRTCGLRCECIGELAGPPPEQVDVEEVRRLRAIVEGMAARIAAQSELLSRRS